MHYAGMGLDRKMVLLLATDRVASHGQRAMGSESERTLATLRPSPQPAGKILSWFAVCAAGFPVLGREAKS